MKSQKIESDHMNWNPQNFMDEDFDPIIPSDEEHEDTYEAARIQDEELADSIKDILSHSQMIDATDIYIQVDNHNVTLTGSVSDFEVKKHTEEVVKLIEGVGEVKNHLSVEYGPL